MAPSADPNPAANGIQAKQHNGHGHGNGNGNGNGNGTTPAPLLASNLTYTYTTSPRPVPEEAAANALPETTCSDHMITASWTAAAGWAAPELKPYGPLSLMPTASVLHYATECFEGLKVYRGFDGRLRLFRPDRNCARMRLSCARVALPVFDPAELEKLIAALLAVDGPRWLPRDRPGQFLYLRPTMIGTQSQLGVQSPSAAMLFVILSFMPVLDAPRGGMRLHTSPEDMVRAWVGGFGYAKLGANYGPSLVATTEARGKGYHQILWLYGADQECTEAGASNFFVVWTRRDGKRELITAPLDDKLILDGVTRRSCLEIARERLAGELEVTERKYSIAEVLEAHAEGRILEAFASGTAYFVCPVSHIHHRGEDVPIPVGPEGAPAHYTALIKGWMGDIIYGREQHEWGVVVEEKEAIA